MCFAVYVATGQEVMGHRDIQTTLRYAHLAPSHIQAAMEKGSLSVLGIGTGSKTGSDPEVFEGNRTQVLDLLARPEGVEPPTLGSEVQCSIH